MVSFDLKSIGNKSFPIPDENWQKALEKATITTEGTPGHSSSIGQLFSVTVAWPGGGSEAFKAKQTYPITLRFKFQRIYGNCGAMLWYECSSPATMLVPGFLLWFLANVASATGHDVMLFNANTNYLQPILDLKNPRLSSINNKSTSRSGMNMTYCTLLIPKEEMGHKGH